MTLVRTTRTLGNDVNRDVDDDVFVVMAELDDEEKDGEVLGVRARAVVVVGWL